MSEVIICICIFLLGLTTGFWICSERFAKKYVGTLNMATLEESPDEPYLYLDLDVHPKNFKDKDIVVMEVKQGPRV